MDYHDAGIADTYRRLRTLPASTMALWRAVLRGLAPAGGARAVLDVGCGTGRFSGCLAETFDATVIGLDASIPMLEAAERDSAVRYVAGMAEAMPVKAAMIDLAFLSMMWHHVTDAARAVAELARVLRPGGVVIVRTPTREILNEFPFLTFFPESSALDERRMPSRSALRGRRFERWMASRPATEPLYEPVDVLVFRR